MKIILIFNNCTWTTIQDKLAAVKSFFAPLPFDFDIEARNLSFEDIPFVTVSALGGITNTLGTTTTVDPAYFDKYISSLDPSADIMVFCLMPGDVAANRTSIAIMQGKVNNVVQCCIFGLQENDQAYINEVNQGNAFVLYVCHEISHALYLIQNDIPDNTHAYFYTGQPTKVLSDLKNGTLTKMQQLAGYLKQLVSFYQEEITIIKPIAMTAQPLFSNKIISWANAIARCEGAKQSLNNPGNLKYSTLTASWGGKLGDNASDGGSICQFPDYNTGFTALCNFLKLGCEDELKAFHQARTLEAFSQVYAGNPPQGYIDGVASILGVPTSVDISTFLS